MSKDAPLPDGTYAICDSVIREIVRRDGNRGYFWKYPNDDLRKITGAGENLYHSANSSDPWFEYRWRIATAEEIERERAAHHAGVFGVLAQHLAGNWP